MDHGKMYDAGNECYEDMSEPVIAAAEAMEVEPDFAVDLGAMEDGHLHVAIEWAGGVLWLDMSEQSDHYCIDVRQFVPDPVRENQSKTTREDGTLVYSADGSKVLPDATGKRPDHGVELAGTGVFTIVNGRRQVLATEEVLGGSAEATPLSDPDGTPVKGHGWNAGYVITLMHDKTPSEKQTNRPAGPGRG